MNLKQKTCCFTGHRIIPEHDVDVITARTEIKIRELILHNGVRFFGVGGAIGYLFLQFIVSTWSAVRRRKIILSASVSYMVQ